MKTRPILFSAPMVKAILAGTKTQTRRLLKGTWDIDEHPDTGKRWPLFPSYVNDGDNEGEPASCPFGVVGDRLWVRETWAAFTPQDYFTGECDEVDGPPHQMRSDTSFVQKHDLVFRADNQSNPNRWRPAIHMPRWASRITLEVTDVRVERLNDISEEDAIAEGVGIDREPCDHKRQSCADVGCLGQTRKSSFCALWEAINGKRAAWSTNPFVWCVTFKRVEASS